MKWEKILKNVEDMGDHEYRSLYGDGSETDFLQDKAPKGEQRIKIIKDVFGKVSEAGDILDAAASWTSPRKYQDITTKISDLLKEIKALEKEAIEHHKGD